MNFVKRAGFSLWSRRGRTLITLCTFLVISVMVLAGVLIADATAQAKNEAKRSVGAEINLVMDLGGQNATGGLMAPQISARTVEKLGASTLVQKHNYSMFDRGVVKGGTELVTGGTDTAASGMGPNGTATVGVLDSALLPDFRSGKFQLLSGAHLTAADKDKRLLLIEERLARKNGLKTGDKITLGANEGTAKAEFTVAGIYRDPRPSSEPEPEYFVDPANMLYASIGGFAGLNATEDRSLKVTKATFLLQDAEDLQKFKEEAERIAGSELDGFQLDANDKAIRQMTGPLDSIGSTAALAMWLIGIAGAAVLVLLVNLAVKQRRKEYGVLLAMGEKKWKLIAQQALEIVAVAALAIGLSSLFTQSLTQSASQSLLGEEAAAARQKLESWQPPAPGSTGIDQGIDPNDKPVENADPIDRIDIRLDPADLATVGAVGLGLGLLATAVPAASVLRLSPRTILTKGK
ncbi:ABC transporter permease [Streptomyces phaeochromogenes]|uniref:ABC transporter permease n=1 Tax=Streptomyces phaeochromogenes TaxID=1923 RepID=UPI00224FD848|nr:ABC transporter permease [Streptomyces phaeochromogenes]MCX5599792.1 ABC transporter permease [Streptomyces phaeochromogenes]